MDLDEVLAPYIQNFKRIFYSQNEQGEERLSVLKLILVGAYLLANLFAFLQFSTISDPILQLKAQIPEDIDVPVELTSVVNYQVPLTIYGILAHNLNFLVLLGALVFIVTQDKPLSMQTKQIRNYSLKSRFHLIGVSIGVFLVSITVLAGLRKYGWSNIAVNYSYGMGTGVNYVWWVIQPTLFLSGALLLVESYTRVDPSFKARFGDLTKPTKKTIGLVLVDLLIIVLIFWIADAVFHVNMNSAENLGIITRVLGIGFYEITIFWLLIHLIILISFTVLNGIILLGVYILKRPRHIAVIIYGLLFILTTLGPLLYFELNVPELSMQFRLMLVIIVWITIFVVPFFFSIIVHKRTPHNEYYLSRIAIIPWILFIAMLLAVIKVSPGLLALEGRIKSLSNWFDLLGLLFTLFFGVIRVTTVSEHPETVIPPKSRNPLRWIKKIRIPAYSRVLILFYIAFIGFYLTLESHTVSVLLNIQNDFRILRLQILAFTSSVGFFYVFWRYNPQKITTESYDKPN